MVTKVCVPLLKLIIKTWERKLICSISQETESRKLSCFCFPSKYISKKFLKSFISTVSSPIYSLHFIKKGGQFSPLTGSGRRLDGKNSTQSIELSFRILNQSPQVRNINKEKDLGERRELFLKKKLQITSKTIICITNTGINIEKQEQLFVKEKERLTDKESVHWLSILLEGSSECIVLNVSTNINFKKSENQ